MKQDTQSGNYELVPLLTTEFSDMEGTLSPDSRWIAYTSNASGRNEVFVQRFPEGGGRRQVSVNGGSQARWRADGDELFYVEGETLMAVPVTQGEELGSARRPRFLNSRASPEPTASSTT